MKPLRSRAELVPAAGLEEDEWLSERFGHAVFTLRHTDPDGPLAVEAPADVPISYQAKVPTREVGFASVMSRHGFAVVNVAIQLAAEPPAVGAPAPPEIEVRGPEPAHAELLPGIAMRSLWASRFHLDPRIPSRIADRVKMDWIDSVRRGRRGDGLLAATIDGALAGFLALASSEDADGGRTRVVDLIAVDPAFQGRGVGSALMRSLLEAPGEGVGRIRVGTQAANVEATRFYENLGFRVEATAFDLHRHVGPVWPGE